MLIVCRKLAYYAHCHYAECCYAECRYAECRGANFRLRSWNIGEGLIENFIRFCSLIQNDNKQNESMAFWGSKMPNFQSLIKS
jgi:hypothetical protein